MPKLDIGHINQIAAKHEGAADAESPPDAPGAPPPDGASGGDSASAGAAGAPPADSLVAGEQGTPPAEATTPAGPTPDHDLLQAKLDADRARRQAREDRRRAKAEAEAATKEREAAAAEKARWEAIGKDKSYLEGLKELGRDPLEEFKKMNEEALRAGTPEAQLDAFRKAHQAEIQAVRDELRAEREARAEAEQRSAAQQAQHRFATTFSTAVRDSRYASLLDDYEPAQLHALATGLRDDPNRMMAAMEQFSLPLTSDDGSYNMIDILNVMKATQDAFYAGKQRRTQQAAPQPGQPSPSEKTATAKRPTVNGTAERNAGNTIGNDLAAQRATEAESLKNMSFSQRRDYLARKYG